MNAENLVKRADLGKEAVNTLGTQGVQNTSSTQINPSINVKYNNLMEKVVERDNLNKAYKKVTQNKGAPGIDGMTTTELGPYLKKHGDRLKRELLEGTYKSSPVKRVEIPKSGGGVRLLGIPIVIDRLIQQAILQILTPIFDPQFSDSSYGFRPSRSARTAVLKSQEYIQQGKKIVVDIDLEKFFDTVDHDKLMSKLDKVIGDRAMMKIIRKYLQAGILVKGCCVRSEEGTPQGGPLSPLLSNIILDELDKELEKRGHTFVRYADDCNIYVKSKRAGERVFESIRAFIEKKLKLKVNAIKSAVDRPWKRKFLGFSYYNVKEGVNLRIAPKTIERFKDKVRELTRRSWSISIHERIERINAYLRGWINYFSIAQNRWLMNGLDEWIRRRMRMCLLKQWKKCRTKLRKLVSLGIQEAWAALIAYSRKKYWRLAKTPQINKALGFDFWQNQGLISLEETYCSKRIL